MPRLTKIVASHAPPSMDTLAICAAGELFGGVERHVLTLIAELNARDIHPLLLLFHDGELAAQARREGTETMILPTSNLLMLQTSRRLAAVLDEAQISVVHVHGYKAMMFCAMARLWRRFSIVKTMHGLPERITGPSSAALRSRLYHLLDEAACRVTGATVCYVTEELRSRRSRRQHARAGPVIPNGIAPIAPSTLRRPPEFEEHWFNVAAVGRLEAVKGLDSAIAALATNGVPSNVHLHLIGTGPCEAQLRTLAGDLHIDERVHFLGFRRNVYDFLAHCDVLIMPSLHEGLPYTLLEGMALGAPIVASRTGGLAEVLQHEVTALLAPAGDAASLASAITRLHDSLELRRLLGGNAQRLQQARYSAQEMTARYICVYRTLTAGDSTG